VQDHVLRTKLGFSLRVLLAASFAASACATAPAKPEGEATEEGGAVAGGEEPLQLKADMEWWRKSMEGRDERVAWFRDARFGMFLHFGVYSYLGGIWKGEPVQGYAEHIQRKNKIPVAVYRSEVAGHFNPTEFNADEWVATAKRAGMGYLIITAKHHDGFAMYDSDVSDYNVVKATPWKHDPMKDLAAACKKHGIKFGFYYSQAWDWEHPDGTGNDWDYTNPGGDKKLFGGTEWWKADPSQVARIRNYVDKKAIPQLKELVAKYDPDIFWFDTPAKLPPEENIRILKAVREAKPNVVVNSRIVQPIPAGPPNNFGDYLSTTDKPAEFPPHDGEWEGIPTTNESYGWHQKDLSHKPVGHFINLLAKAAARGGNVLLNIGPMGTGKFDPKDAAILDGIGTWMKVNAESIHGTVRTGLPVQAWGETTRKGNMLYLHVTNWPRKGRIVVGGLKSNVKRAYLLADAKHAPLTVERAGDKDIVIQGPDAAPDETDAVVVAELDGELQADRQRLLSTDVPLDVFRAFDGQPSGLLSFGAGKIGDAYVRGWSQQVDSIRWVTRLTTPATFDVGVAYDAEKKNVGGTYQVRLRDKIVSATVQETPSEILNLGRVTLEPGPVEIAVEPTKIQGGELMRLRALTLTPIVDGVALPAKKAAAAPAKGGKAAKPAKKKKK
jgi:alpha-L-fucosidase